MQQCYISCVNMDNLQAPVDIVELTNMQTICNARCNIS